MKNIIGLIVLFLLVVAAYLIYQSQEGGSSFLSQDEAFKDFAIEDTASIDQIFMSQANGKKILITRRGFDKWMVNGKFEARPDAIGLILKTAHDIKIQAPVSDKTFEGVVKRLASGSTKIEYYLKGEEKPEKVWYIGDPTSSRLGTYSLLEKDGKKSSKPYITHMLMERGFLGPRYFLDPQLWRDRLFLRLKPEEIKSLTVTHDADSMIDFKLEQVSTASFELTNLESNEKIELNSEVAIPYLKLFGKVYYEYIDLKTPQYELDSIYNSPVRHTLNLEMINGDTFEMKTHYLPVKQGAMLDGVEIFYHPERMYAYSSYMGEESYPIVQNLTFDPLLSDFKRLASSTTVEK